MTLWKICGIISLVFLPHICVAQITYGGCRDINGIPVQSIQSTSINDIAVATIANGHPVIFFNPYVVAQSPPAVRLFFYAHECGHHALGHVLGGRVTIDQEQEADCFGINELVRAGLVNDAQITVIQRSIYSFGRADWTHLPGPQRAINLRACLSMADNGSGRQSDNNDSIEDCVTEKIEGCMDDCTGNYNYSETACRARLCNPQYGSNRRWESSCRRKLR